ncbi:MAG: hypothetical protein Q4D41_07550 [Prevotellaceae bacterium]|nr:hypothetical protein [Prevotellaceae bacterium]
MKKFFTLVAAALTSLGAFAQAHCEWTAAQLPTTEFATVDDAVAAGYQTMWGYPQYLGMPAQNLIENDNIVVSLPLDYSYVSVGNSKYSGASEYAYKIIMGMNNSTRDGIDPLYFYEGVVNNDYVRSAGTSDQGNTINDAVIKIEVKSTNYGKVTLKYNRGGNNAAMYVVDQTANEGQGMMVLQTVTRCPDENIQTHTASFGVEPSHTYYIMASEKGSVELYGIEYDECTDDDYTLMASEENSTDLWTAAQLPTTVFATADEAVAAGYQTLWGYPQYLGMPAQNLVESENVVVSLPLDYSYISTGNSKYSGYTDYAYKLIMGMNNSTRSGIDPLYFYEGVVNNDYIRSAGTSDQGNTINDAVVKVEVPSTSTYGRVILNYNRGGNNSAMYVVDQTANSGQGKMVLQTVTRCPDDYVKTHTSIFNVEPGHTYYVMASEKGSVELYAIGFCATTSEKYAAVGGTSGIENVNVSNVTKVADNKVYSIDGRYVGNTTDNLSKGLYIMNGKKFVVK